MKHAPYNKLKGKMREIGVNQENIAKTIGISVTSVSQKINGISDFKISEVKKLQEVYGFSSDIFLSN